MKKTYLELINKPFLKENAAKYLYEHEGLLVRQAAAFGEVQAYESRFAQYNSMTQ